MPHTLLGGGPAEQLSLLVRGSFLKEHPSQHILLTSHVPTLCFFLILISGRRCSF